MPLKTFVVELDYYYYYYHRSNIPGRGSGTETYFESDVLSYCRPPP